MTGLTNDMEEETACRNSPYLIPPILDLEALASNRPSGRPDIPVYESVIGKIFKDDS